MTDQQPTFPPAGRYDRPIPIVRRHWDGNGWTSSASAADAAHPGAQPGAAVDPRFRRTAG